ncbi:MAG: hypothetical protein EIB84_03630 [Spiroplasma poulsonii]|uniref:DUF3137 domain-containing protein n=1 Tax=Spiroplasma poulsonii TaxID=2138 RepID=A0A2P6FD68_9MOLU|nr:MULTISPECIES: hypothetical protein [Spiroplasma]KAF0851030.1 hypothetical protein MSROBK_012630 [Spiroplasma poulsonii]MBH8623004.1 hypothetical protein [Spiroplasma sp. hyd1]MBW1241947.1 hypothetical protein [Spiroplasma poulsonii]PQM31401.1 hypothetical protein SMSRO_SF012320 [Spiroplasma poulsonii]PWF96415.1 hypothetical protein SMSE_18620 [Spiroplasma poulsonii]
MINEENSKQIEIAIDNVYQKVIIKKKDRIVAWQWINLFFYLFIMVSLFLTIFSFVVTYDLHFQLNKTIFLPVGIVAFLCFITTTTLIIFIKKHQKDLTQQIKNNFDITSLIDLYNTIFANIMPDVTITDITTKWTITPTNHYPINEFKVNDKIIVGKYQNIAFNIGSISQATTTVVDNLEPNLMPKPYNTQYYRYLFLTVTTSNFQNNAFEINRKNKYPKNNLTFDNFFWYDQTNPNITPTLKTLILDNMVTTTLIPNIKVTPKALSLQLATISTNSWIDNCDSLFNFNISLNKNVMLDNMIETIKHDYQTLQKSFVWLNLILKHN